METNPYAAPQASGEIDLISISALSELVKGWEKQRLIFNAALLLPGIVVLVLLVTLAELPVVAAALLGLVGGIGANIGFFLGPLAELYLRALFFKGKPLPWIRRLLLVGGIFTSLAAMGICSLLVTTSVGVDMNGEPLSPAPN